MIEKEMMQNAGCGMRDVVVSGIGTRLRRAVPANRERVDCATYPKRLSPVMTTMRLMTIVMIITPEIPKNGTEHELRIIRLN